jgi:hypothetical protein
MAEDFMNAVYKGTGTTFAGLDYNTPDYELLSSLQRSVYSFSAAKSWHINKDLTGLLHDGTRLRSFSEFQKEALGQLGVYIGQWGKIEYSSALVNSEMAGKIQRFRADADIMPYWQFKTSKGEHVCEICAPYDDVIALHDAPVWKYATPQLHYGCYCTIVQLPGQHYTPTPHTDLPPMDKIPKIFRTDIAGKMQAFPPDHPYWHDVPRKSVNKWVNKHLPADE